MFDKSSPLVIFLRHTGCLGFAASSFRIIMRLTNKRDLSSAKMSISNICNNKVNVEDKNSTNTNKIHGKRV